MDRRTLLRSGLVLTAATSSPANADGMPGQTAADVPKGLGSDRIKQTIQRRSSVSLNSLNRKRVIYPSMDRPYELDGIQFTKGQLHNSQLDVDVHIQGIIAEAISASDMSQIERFYQGQVPLVCPVSGNGYSESGRDRTQLNVNRPFSLSSPEFLWEARELAWAAICRDVPFTSYNDNALTMAASYDLFGPSLGSNNLSSKLFQPMYREEFNSSYVSQLLLCRTTLGGIQQSFKGIFSIPNKDYLTDFPEYLAVQNGQRASVAIALDPDQSEIVSGRSLADLVRQDFPAQFFMNAASLLYGFGDECIRSTNPYARMTSQSAFVSLGPAHCFDLLNRAACSALKACWYYKWDVFNRLRPEEYFGQVEVFHSGGNDAMGYSAMKQTECCSMLYSQFGNYLLPQAYPAGSPLHPSYPAGHAVVAGACGTILKYMFNTDFKIRPDELTKGGNGLTSNTGYHLGEEIDKLMWNVSFARCFAGIHWRMDCQEGIKLGEQVALDVISSILPFMSESCPQATLYSFCGHPMLAGADFT